MSWGWGWQPYVSVAERRRRAAAEMAKMRKKGKRFAPVTLAGRTIAATFWGKAWCENLESYSDFENRLPRGRSYVRNGSVMDLQIRTGKVSALVSGSSLYRVEIGIEPLKPARWRRILSQSTGQIDSLVELLQGRLSRGVMEIMTRRKEGLFPTPGEITLSCSCPDWATMCKHVAASLYGVGARLDEHPELLFVLRGVDHLKLIRQAPAARVKRGAAAAKKDRLLHEGAISDIFGIDVDTVPVARSPEEKILSAKTHRKAKSARAPVQDPAEVSVEPSNQPSKKSARKASSRSLREERKRRAKQMKAYWEKWHRKRSARLAREEIEE